MPVSDITQAAQTVAAQSNQPTRNIGKELGKDEFMRILVTQLQNQDPLSPMDDTDFIAQLAQFSTLEQMQSLNSSFTFGQAYNLIGKSVYSTITNDQGIPQDVFGKVTGVLSSKGAAYLEIDGHSYIPFTNDVVVYEPDIDNPAPPPEQTDPEADTEIDTQTNNVQTTNTQTATTEPGTAETENIEAYQTNQNETTAASGSTETQEVISLGDPSTRVMDY